MVNSTPATETEFNQWIRKRFNVYNSIFLNLPYKDISSFGVLIPVLYRVCREGLDQGKDPMEILDGFFGLHLDSPDEKEKIDFMFRIIQYIERQIVLYDGIEDSAFPHLHNPENKMSFHDLIHLSKNKNLSTQLWDKLSNYSVRIVFTAHPTQFYPPAVLDIIGRLKLLIDNNDINGVDLTLQQLGLTSLLNAQKPTPFEEAKNIIYYLRNVYYDAMGEFYSTIKQNHPEGKFDNPGLVRLGFWPGGDRDGNPYVTADITMKVADELRMTLMKCYYQDIKALEKKMTFREVEQLIRNLKEAIYPNLFDPLKTLRYESILHPLLKLREAIVNRYNSLYLGDLDQFIDKVNIFKTHFATLDIRQDHRVHKKAVEEILKRGSIIKNSLDELQKDELKSILLTKSFDADPDLFSDEVVRQTLKNIRQLKDIQAKNGEWGCNRYIISNSEDIFSVLFVLSLFKWSGYKEDELTMDIVPLFETMQGMRNARSTMEELILTEAYRSHLTRRENKQTIMLGFSDGTKDGGYMKANWSIFKTKEALTLLCEQSGIAPVFFDGRGGPPARGGGKTHRFYAAQSPRIANHEIQLTVQGQTITSRYGTTAQFIHNCEQLITAGLSRGLSGKEKDIPPQQRELLEEIAQISHLYYQALKDHDKFLPYLEHISTLKYYSQANIGSRPAKRGSNKQLKFSDLRAISFVGSWSQLKQNVPGYFGLGTALKTLESKGKLADLQQLFNEVPYFKALILNSMMSLSKCNFALTSYLSKDPDYKDFWEILHHEYQLSVEMVLRISGYKNLMEEEPLTRSSIQVREQIVLPLLVIQQYALQKTHRGSTLNELYEKIIIRSLYGNINASRNSA